MNTNARRVAQMLTGILIAFCAMTIILLYLFEGNIGGTLRYQAITSGVFCVYLIYAILICSKGFAQRPFRAYLVAGFYLIVCLLLSFPNRYLEKYALIYLIVIPIACFFGFRHAIVVVLSTATLSIYSAGGIERGEVLHIIYVVIAALTASGKKYIKKDILSAVVAFILQATILLLSKSTLAMDLPSFLTEIGIIAVNSITIPVVYRLDQLKESGQLAEETMPEETKIVQMDGTVDNSEIVVSESAESQKNVSVVPQGKKDIRLDYPLNLSYLVSEECEILKSMIDFAPRAVERAREIASFARQIAYKFGANSDLVYAAAIYHDVERIYKGEPGAEVVLPEYLYTIIKRQNEKQPPTSMEELIVLLSNNVLAIYHYMEKKHPQVSVAKVIDNLFAHQLKNGIIMSAGISMSVYHKLKQEFMSEFIVYLEDMKK